MTLPKDAADRVSRICSAIRRAIIERALMPADKLLVCASGICGLEVVGLAADAFPKVKDPTSFCASPAFLLRQKPPMAQR